jgi:6-phosphogluconolactonase
LVEKILPNGVFDLVMLGMGEDGHTASLFPKTHGLHAEDRFVIANFIPQKNVWRMSLTFECINAARNIVIYVLGKSKASMVKQVLSGPYQPDDLPIQRVGTREHKALWVFDNAAAENLNRNGVF